MPVLLILILGVMTVFFWDYVRENIDIIGPLATSLAFLATAWAAYEARQSAKAAMKATQLTASSLIEMKNNSFKNWLELLLEQHDKILMDVNQALKDDKDFKTKSAINSIKAIYYHVTKKAIFIKYINHIVLILNYIDKEFYLPHATKDQKETYIEQLRNSINSEANLIIAIFGLNIDNIKTYNAKKLFTLLNDFVFFEKELFFSAAMSNVNYLNTYVSGIFNKEYRERVEFYIDQAVMNRHDETILSNVGKHTYIQRTTIALMWSYVNPCRHFLLEEFDTLPQSMRKKIILDMQQAVMKITEFESTLPDFLGYTLCLTGKKDREIKSEKQIKRLLKIY